MKEILKEGGVKKLYSGIIPNLILVLNPMINFGIYEFLRRKFVKPGKAPGFFIILIISLFAKTIATLLTYPVLTIKTLAYVNKASKVKIEDQEFEQTFFKKLLSIYKEFGFTYFMRGIYTKLF